jgi:hypothetical protein
VEDEPRRTEIARRLKEASAAHFEYEQTVLKGVYDQQWAEWYADYLIAHDWNALFRSAWNVPQLADALRRAHADQRANAPETVWQEHYAELLVKVQ